MKRALLRSLLTGLLACLLLGAAAPLLRADEDGSSLEEMRKKILEQKEEAEKQEEQEEPEPNEDDDAEAGLLWQLFFELLRFLFVYSASERYADFPYAAWPSHPFGLSVEEKIDEGYRQPGYASLVLDGAHLFADRWGVSARLAGNLLAVHLEGFSQVLFDPSDRLVFYSGNAGITLPFRRLIVNLFLGAFGSDTFSGALFSFGIGAQLFLPGRCILELYNLNAVYGPLHFHYLTVSLDYAFSPVNVGVGFNLNNYAGVLVCGPQVRLSFWL
jgi:hypothetical protein